MSDNHQLQVIQNNLNRMLTQSKRCTPTEELCRLTDSLSIQQTIAYSTLTTAFKILSTKKPDFLYRKFKRNERDTAFLLQKRKGLSKEGFVYRAICLLNQVGDEILQSNSEKEFKSRTRSWVKVNIDIKPKNSQKSMRFSQRIQSTNRIDGDENDQGALLLSQQGQPRITQFFRHV